MHAHDLSSINSVLCLGAHADDIEIGCGGVLLHLLRRVPQLRVHWVVFSAAGERRGEATASAAAFLGDTGDQRVDVLDYSDSVFPTQWAAIKESFNSIRSDGVDPQLVLTHRRDDAHQDHRVIAELTWCTFRDHWILEYEIPKYEGDLGQPNFYVPLTDDIAGRKADLLMESFPSQQSKPWFTRDTFLALARIRGLEAGAHYAEGFYASKTVGR